MTILNFLRKMKIKNLLAWILIIFCAFVIYIEWHISHRPDADDVLSSVSETLCNFEGIVPESVILDKYGYDGHQLLALFFCSTKENNDYGAFVTAEQKSDKEINAKVIFISRSHIDSLRKKWAFERIEKQYKEEDIFKEFSNGIRLKEYR